MELRLILLPNSILLKSHILFFSINFLNDIFVILFLLSIHLNVIVIALTYLWLFCFLLPSFLPFLVFDQIPAFNGAMNCFGEIHFPLLQNFTGFWCCWWHLGVILYFRGFYFWGFSSCRIQNGNIFRSIWDYRLFRSLGGIQNWWTWILFKIVMTSSIKD